MVFVSYEWWFYMLYFPIVQVLINHKFVYLVSIISAITYLFYPNFSKSNCFIFVIYGGVGLFFGEFMLLIKIKLNN
jgi:hypothetical protein